MAGMGGFVCHVGFGTRVAALSCRPLAVAINGFGRLRMICSSLIFRINCYMPMIFTYTRQGYCISTDPDLLDLPMIHAFLSQETYWAADIPFEVVEKALRHSFNFGLYQATRQIGLARVITDFATFGYLCDVFVVEGHRGQGLSKWLMSCIMDCPALVDLRRFMLMTKDAHGLYSQFGFTALKDATKAMEITRPDIYKKKKISGLSAG